MSMSRNTLFLTLLLFALVVPVVRAVPLLQVYIEGATYDMDHEDWVTTNTTFTLWVIGNTGGGNGGDILDLHLTAAYLVEDFSASNQIGITAVGAPTPTFDLYGPNGPSGGQVARVPGAVPIREDGRPIPTHGVYGRPDVQFDQWHLGDMLDDGDNVPIQDMVGGGWSTGKIWKYTLTTSGYQAVHFDVFNHVSGEYSGEAIHSVFSPWSHDAEFETPEPSAALILGLGLLGLGGARAARRRRRATK